MSSEVQQNESTEQTILIPKKEQSISRASYVLDNDDKQNEERINVLKNLIRKQLADDAATYRKVNETLLNNMDTSETKRLKTPLPKNRMKKKQIEDDGYEEDSENEVKFFSEEEDENELEVEEEDDEEDEEDEVIAPPPKKKLKRVTYEPKKESTAILSKKGREIPKKTKVISSAKVSLQPPSKKGAFIFL